MKKAARKQIQSTFSFEISRTCYLGQQTVWLRAALVSSSLVTGMVTGMAAKEPGSDSASLAASIITSMKASMVALLSVSVGSIIIASLTISGKYTVGGW